MDYHVGSLASIISQKSHGKLANTKLFEKIPSVSTEEVKFKVVSVKKQREEEPLVEKKKIKINPGETKSKSINAQNAEKRIKGFKPKPKVTEAPKVREANPEEDNRTIFVGNLPCNIKLIKLKKLFKSYGEIECARFRCPPVKDPRIPKRVAIIRKEFHPDRTNIVGYVRFTSAEEARNALQANGMLFREHHLRVDLATRDGSHDQKKAVFVGNLHFGAEENDLWKVFESCGPIDSIRIVRDSITGVGKGFCYVNFKDLSSVELALQLDGHLLKERPLRISRAVKRVPQKREEYKSRLGVKRKRFKVRNQGNEEKEKNHKPRQIVNREDDQGNETVIVKKRKPRFNLKEVVGKGKVKAKTPAKEEPSYLGTTADGDAKGKKKMKLSKSELKKRVLAFQLQLKKAGVSSPPK